MCHDIGESLRFHCRPGPCLRRAWKVDGCVEEPGMRGGRFADSLSGWFGLSGLSRSQPNKLNKPKKPDQPNPNRAACWELTPCSDLEKVLMD